MDLRPLGTTSIRVSPVALGCWPLAGMTSPGTSEADGVATIESCFELGVNHLDTAYCYGASGESERFIARAIRGRRDEVVIATKGGIHWAADGKQIFDAHPKTLRRECDESLARLETDCVELYYLHAPDPTVPVAESAGALAELMKEGKTRSVGASNLSLAQLKEFVAECPLAAIQPPYNMLQRDIEAEILPWCRERQISVLVYWPLMKGLLTGKFPREHKFPPGDGRLKYPMFQKHEWQRNQDFMDELRALAAEIGRTVSQIVINWTIYQPGITAALCGAKRPEQIRDTAGALAWRLSPEQLERIHAALARRGKAATRAAV